MGLFEEGGWGRMIDHDSQLEGGDRVSSSSLSIIHRTSSSNSSPQGAKLSPTSSEINVRENKFINTHVTKQAIIDLHLIYHLLK